KREAEEESIRPKKGDRNRLKPRDQGVHLPIFAITKEFCCRSILGIDIDSNW
ncbi:hypothetical protein NL676_036579, partial [Syzygium grande]